MQISHLPGTAHIGALVILPLAPFGAATSQGTSPADLALDSVLNTRISAASQYAQTAAQAPHVSYAPGGAGPAVGLRSARISLAITNALNVDILTPAGYGSLQTSFRQPGRAASVQPDWRF